VKDARDSAQARAESLRKHAEERKDKLSVWWDKLQREWNGQMTSIRRAFEKDRTEHDAKKAKRAAESADEDAEFAVDFAYAAIEEAEYAVLDARLAHVEADELTNA